MSKNASTEVRGSALTWLNTMIDGDELQVELKTKKLTTRARNFNNTLILYGHPAQFVLIMDSLKSAGVWTRFD